MAKCAALTISGKKCKNTAVSGKRYCSSHSKRTKKSRMLQRALKVKASPVTMMSPRSVVCHGGACRIVR